MEVDLKHIKEEVVAVCRKQLQASCDRYKAQMTSLREALGSESKSTAGDKHETGRAMVQLEMERAAARWKESEEQLKMFERLAFQGSSGSGMVGPGALVQTDKAFYYLSVSVGIVKAGGCAVGVISGASPMGALLRGKKAADQITFNGMSQKIIAIC